MTGIATNQNAILHALEPGECLEPDELAERLPEIARENIIRCVGMMITHGICERAAVGCYRLTAKGCEMQSDGTVLKSGPRGPLTRKIRRVRRSTFRQRVWNGIRIQRKFTLDDVVRMAAMGTEKDPGNNALGYVLSLERAGYLRRLPRQTGIAPTSNGFVRWALLDGMNTGPEAPVVRTKGGIYDPNRDEVLGGADG